MYGLRGLGDVVPSSLVAQPVVVYSSRSGETVWDFIDSTANQTPTEFLSKYKLALGTLGAALLVGFYAFRRQA